jgi:hypothetical protein
MLGMAVKAQNSLLSSRLRNSTFCSRAEEEVPGSGDGSQSGSLRAQSSGDGRRWQAMTSEHCSR